MNSRGAEGCAAKRRRSGHAVGVLNLEAAGLLVRLVAAAAVVVAANRLEPAVDANLALAELALAVFGASWDVLGEGDDPVAEGEAREVSKMTRISATVELRSRE